MNTIHHIAIKAQNLELLKYFYQNQLHLKLVDKQLADDGHVRSYWFDLNGSILMLEEAASQANQEDYHDNFVIAFKIEPEKRLAVKKDLTSHGVAITKETEYSFYFSDPEGNELAYSHYPKKIPA